MSEITDRWATGAHYEDFMGRWSRALATRFVSWLGLPPGLDWLDVGCGTGALTQAILDQAQPASVVACDPAAPFVEYARDRPQDERVSFVVGGAGDLPKREGGYGTIASSLALNFIPAPAAAVVEMRGLARRGGTISACVWDYAGGMEFLRRFWDAAIALDPAARRLDEGVRFPLCRPDSLTDLFLDSGLNGVRCEALEIPTRFANFDDYWRPLLTGTGPAPSYVASLDDERRSALEGRLRESLPAESGGVISLTARAWAVRGTAS
jgi:SAM-dependent methyltransferase